MDSVPAEAESCPEVELEQMLVQRHEASERWVVGWQIKNIASYPLRIDSVQLPHGQFKSEEQRFEPALFLASYQQAAFETRVRCEEAEGVATENAFLIFQALWAGNPWRIFVRVKVEVNAKREPHVQVVLITAQRVGFSGFTR